MGGTCSACGGEEICLQVFGGVILLESDNLEDPDEDSRIILICIFRKWDVGVWTASSWLRVVTGGGHL